VLIVAAAVACDDPTSVSDDLRSESPYVTGPISSIVVRADGDLTTILVERTTPNETSCSSNAVNVDVAASADVRWSSGAVASASDFAEGQVVTVWVVASELTMCTPSTTAGAVTIVGAPSGVRG
jgi:hypothetical protein